MASTAKPDDQVTLYQHAHDLLVEAMALLDSVEDSLTAARLSLVVELIDTRLDEVRGT